MIQEEWRPIKGYEGVYEVSSLARVRSLDVIKNTLSRMQNPMKRPFKGKVLTPKLSNSGYLFVQLYSHSRSKNKYIHRLVAEAFCPNPDNQKQVNHKDECKTNNLPENLEWCDGEYNTNYGTGMKRMAAKRAKTVEQVTLEGIVIAQFLGVPAASRATGVGQSNIERAVRNQGATACGYYWRYAN